MNLFWIPVIASLILLIWFLNETWPRDARQEFDRAVNRFMAVRAASAETAAEIRFRRAMVELRRRATKMALERPGTIRDDLPGLIKQIASRISTADRKEARTFAEVAGELPLSDILYVEGMRAVERKDAEIRRIRDRYRRDHPPDEHDVAVFRTV